MNIKIGQLYVNKTWRFLIPCLEGYGKVFEDNFNTVFKLAVAIHDSYLDGASITNGRNLYIMLDKKCRPKEYLKFMEYIKYQDCFKGEYCPDGDILTSRKNVIILEVPKIYNNAYDNFLKGKYSEMYSEEKVDLFFNTTNRQEDFKILTKHQDAIINFKSKIDNLFKVDSDINEIKKGELELPLSKTEEIFNCKMLDTVYFNEKLDKVWQ